MSENLDDDFGNYENDIDVSKYKRKKEDSSGRGGKKMNRSSQGRSKKQSNPIDPSSSLFEIVKQGRSSFQAVVDEWIERYKKDKIVAVGNLMQFFIDSSGCKGRITPEMQTTMEHADIIRKMTEQFDEDSADYPIIMSGIYKRFRQNFCDFIEVLIKQCQYSIIFDPFVIDNLLHFLIGLADSQIRPFRHTSTLAALKIMSALVDVVLNININLEYAQRQFETEKQKCHGKRPTERLEMLTQKKQEIEENMNDVCTQLTYIFRSIFVHRYRDSVPDIRAMCMQEIGIWMKKFPKMFLDDSYLKYIGWTLYDKVGEVRLKCLLSLQPLYASEELTLRLELFTNKFKDRIIAMTLDKEYEVAVQAVRLVNNILKYHREILTDRDCEHVYELVYSIHRQVAQAAGEFLKERLFTLDEEALGKSVKTKRGKKRLPNTPLIRDLVQFFIESELHEHGAYLVDSLIETNEMMKDWECMTDLLLEEPGRGEDALDNHQETSLIEIMTCCVKQAATGEPPVGRSISRKGHSSAKENKLLSEERVKLTEHFIVTLPSLLAKYIVDPEKISNLLQIPQFFDLDVYTSSRSEKHLELLLKYAEEIMLKHSHPDVLSACAKTYEYLCLDQHLINGKCKISRSTLVDTLVERFKTTFKEFVQEKEEHDEDQIFAITSSLKRLAGFNEFHDMSSWELWDNLIFLLKAGCDTGKQDRVPQEVIRKALAICHYHILWFLANLNGQVLSKSASSTLQVISNVSSGESNNLPPAQALPASTETTQAPAPCTSVEAGNGPPVVPQVPTPKPSSQVSAQTLEQIKVLKQRATEYVLLCQELMFAGSNIEEDAYLSICDLLIAFNRHITQIHSTFQPLVLEPDRNLITQLNSFVVDKVFVSTPEGEEESLGQGKIEQLRKGRNFLASFCKLIIYNIIGIQNAVDIFRNYTKFYTDYGDIIKMTISKAREINKVKCAKVMITALQYHFKSILNLRSAEDNTETVGDGAVSSGNKNNAWHEGFSSLKELGRRFCLSFGLDQIKNREAIALIHKEGIIFSLSSLSGNITWDNVHTPGFTPSPPKNIYFLEVVGEFSNKLMKQDKRTVLTFLERHLPPGALSYKGEEWQPLFAYRNSLLQNIENESYNRMRYASASTPAPPNMSPLLDHNLSNPTNMFTHHGVITHNKGAIENSNIASTSSLLHQDLHPIYEHEEEMAEIGEKDLNMFLGTNLTMEDTDHITRPLVDDSGKKIDYMQIHNAHLQQHNIFSHPSNINDLASFVMNADMTQGSENTISSLDQLPHYMI